MRASGGRGAQHRGAPLALAASLCVAFGLGAVAQAFFAPRHLDDTAPNADLLRAIEDPDARGTASTLFFRRSEPLLHALREHADDPVVRANLGRIAELCR